MNSSFFGELLQAISDRGRVLIDRRRARRDRPAETTKNLADLCEELLSNRGEASGVALAREILLRYADLTTGPRIAFFEAMTSRFGIDRGRVEAAIASWLGKPGDGDAAALHAATEPRRMELLRRLNLAPQATSALVEMRTELLDVLPRRKDLVPVDADFASLFSTWFNRGFLVLRRIDWSTPAVILEKIIRYEAVHQIRDWEDLRARIDSPDRRCYAFFHPALVDEPLIFVEVALTREIPGAIAPILAVKREPLDPERATTAVFYSISNCQRGLTGVSFGSFLIKQVVGDITRDMPKLSTFVTLSPVSGFAAWLADERSQPALPEADRKAFMALDRPEWWNDAAAIEELREPMMRAAATYFMTARNKGGAPLDAVARFHLGNGARLERLNWPGDLSDRGRRQAFGLMVNYQYDLGDIEKNHEAYAENRTIIAANGIRRLARPSRAVTTTKSAAPAAAPPPIPAGS